MPCIINPRRACAARVMVVGSVCLSVRASTHFSIVCSSRKQYDLLNGNDNQFNLAGFSEYGPLQRSEHGQHSTHTKSAIFFFYSAENTHAHYFYHMFEVAICFRWRGRRWSEVA